MILKLIQKIDNAIEYLFAHSINEKKFLSKYIKNKKIVCVDIGANKGNFIDLIINNFKVNKIYAFEPSLNNFLILKKDYQNAKIFLEKLAISDKKKKLDFYEYKLSSQSSLYKQKKNNSAFDELENKYKIQSITLDDYFKNEKKRIDICKVDVQGEELSIIKGMKNLLKKKQITLVKIELSFIQIYEKSSNHYLDIINLLKKFDYELITISKSKFQNQNLFFLDAYFVHKNYVKN